MPWWGTALVTLVAALLAAAPGVLAYRASMSALETSRENAVHADDSKRRDIEAGAYERARKSYEAGLTELERQLSNLRSQLSEERDISNTLRNQMRELEDTVARMRRQMMLAGIDTTPIDGRSTP